MLNFRQDSFRGPAHYNTKRPWTVLFRLSGSVWCSVLPYCIINCGITYLLYALRANTEPQDQSKFSAQGHALMSLIVSYLVVSKVYVSLDRFMDARAAVGRAMSSLRELHQLMLVFTQTLESDHAEAVALYRSETADQISTLIDCMIDVLQDERKANRLARDEGGSLERDDTLVQDPLIYIHALREHIYIGHGLPEELHILERSKMLDKIHVFVEAYTEVLKLASTALPFSLVQLGRTFLFLYTFTLPLALMGFLHDESSMLSVQMFVFFLTYGFVGLEFVSMKLLLMFGKESTDIPLEDLGEACLRGVRADRAASEGRLPSGYSSVLNKNRPESLKSKRRIQLGKKTASDQALGTTNPSYEEGTGAAGAGVYHSMA